MTVGQEFEDGDSDDVEVLPELTDAERADLDETLRRPLSSFGIAEIMRELELRYPAFVFYSQERKVDDTTGCFTWAHGNYHVIVGLAQAYIWKLQQEF